MPELDDLRGELASIAGSLRAYLEQQAGSGATGIPRGEGRPRRVEAAPPAPAPIQRVAPAPPTPAPFDPEPLATPMPKPKPPVVTPAAALPPPAPPTEPGVVRSIDPVVRLPQLAQEIAACTKCVLAETRTQTVFARGNPGASICFIGEAPGADEDAQGVPFVGRAGQLLDKMIDAMGLSPVTDVYVVNIIRCRPPGNRKPEAEEIAACIPYLHEQLELAKPKVIVAMGNTAVGTLLNTKLGITKLRGQWKLYRGSIPVMPTYHPSYLLRPSAQQAEAKKQAWEDLQAVLTELKLPIPPPKKKVAPPPAGER